MDLPNRPSRTTSATVHRFTPLTLFILAAFTFVLGVSSVALIADNIVYVNRQRHESDWLFVEFHDGVRAVIEYFPHNLRMETTYVLLAAGIIGILGSLVVGVGLLVNGKSGKKDGKVRLPLHRRSSSEVGKWTDHVPSTAQPGPPHHIRAYTPHLPPNPHLHSPQPQPLPLISRRRPIALQL